MSTSVNILIFSGLAVGLLVGGGVQARAAAAAAASVAWNEVADPHTWGDNFVCY